ncbi:hypothetical protein A7K93_00585 [Candidatus Methylacidiphilum fumarolicum]|nr:hypothetical protein A7K73_05320 [Candidatus Methylacidiphilum fumarolicum]TFE73827.1 hypothetical protein A7K72_05920 [Candidatus Methylacidiphilum fumarolicum]TFE75567.1 hypothetical protein A7K93_00585 [Candidatus Methylacidiphilum fumarolicum]TFE76728.1 hypothetical protein A7D33_08025 [Candidatus Methylacidiphilum fumarolicum]
MPAWRVCELYGGVSAYHLKKRIGGRKIFFVDAAELAACDAIGGFICNSGLPPDENPDEGYGSEEDGSRHRKHVCCNGHDEVLDTACFPRRTKQSW